MRGFESRFGEFGGGPARRRQRPHRYAKRAGYGRNLTLGLLRFGVDACCHCCLSRLRLVRPAALKWPETRVDGVFGPSRLSSRTCSTINQQANHHDGELSPPMMKGAYGSVSGRVPVRETSSERFALKFGGHTPFTVTTRGSEWLGGKAISLLFPARFHCPGLVFSILYLRRKHPDHVFTIWYLFSISIIVFSSVYYYIWKHIGYYSSSTMADSPVLASILIRISRRI